MITEEQRNTVLLWLPFMMELEADGHNPVKFMFGNNDIDNIDVEHIEIAYKTLRKCELKYPEWYKVIQELGSQIILKIGEQHASR